MRDPDRIPRILGKIEHLWNQNPDWRLGQLVSNTMGAGPQDVFHLEDEELEHALNELIVAK